LAKVACPQQFGVAEINGSRVIRLEEKPQKPRSDLALVGVYLFDKTIFDAVNAIQPSGRGELEITDAIQYLIDHKARVDHTIVEGWWKDTGKLDDILEANRIVLDAMQSSCRGTYDAASKLEGKIIIEEGAHILRSTIRGPAIIGKNTIIEDSYIGPFTAVYHDVIIKQSEIEHSIVLEHSRISDMRRLADSLIGQYVEINKSPTKPSAYRIMVGDSSKIEII
jgi:glucose-1-phosphate thymidylyltransferase